MSLHQIDFEYKLPEWGTMVIEMDPVLDQAEKEEIALAEIKENYDDIVDIQVTKVIEVE